MKEKIENMDRRTFWTISIVIFIFMYFLKDTLIGRIMFTISFFALIFTILNFAYQIIRHSIELHQYKKRKDK